MRIIRYITSGLIGVIINLELYRLLIEHGVSGKIVGSIIATTCSTVVSFFIQKYWTFDERNLARVHKQFVLYIFFACINIGLSTVIVSLLVVFLKIYYLIAQATAAATVAVLSFFVYREIIFKVKVNDNPSSVLL